MTTAAPTPGSDPTGGNPPTIAAFSPAASSPASRSSFQVHQKSPLLIATPPRVTQALSKSYAWIRALDWALSLLTWTSKDPWESFLVVAAFWALVLYGDTALKWAGNILAVAAVIAGMYARRWRRASTTTTLDEILDSVNMLNTRMDLFFAPCVTLLSILETETSATTATTRPALTTLFIRILLLTPVWLAFAVYPFRLITGRRIVLFVGTLLLTWHSRPAKVARTILWRSASIRRITVLATGLDLSPPVAAADTAHTDAADTPITKTKPPLPPRTGSTSTLATHTASPGVKFTFSIYENQRRWLGMGWTANLFPYERAAWTDEHLQPCAPPAEFQLPQTPGAGVQWRWVPGEEWAVETGRDDGRDGREGRSRMQGVKDKVGGPGAEGEGWWYYDNKWRDGSWGRDGWGKYTRRRKWVRRAELVEVAEVEKGEAVEREEEDDRGSVASAEGKVGITVTDADEEGDEGEEMDGGEEAGKGKARESAVA